jgi:O-antigen ligase
LILWESTVELLKKDNTWLFGLGTQNFQEKLDNQVLIHNGYLFTRHLTPHNLFLSYWLQYGLLGVFIVFLLFYLLVRKAIAMKRISLFLLTLFLFFSVQTEIYLDREMGVNLFIWILVVLYSGKESRAESELANI